jgi:hypothetical protein
MCFAEIEAKYPFWASFRERLTTEVPSFNAEHLVETKKAKERDGVHEAHHQPLAGPSPNPKAIFVMWEGRGPGRQRDGHVKLKHLSDT